MTCPKCNGLMVEEWLMDDVSDTIAWRCLNCGRLLDAVIDRNQRADPSHEKPTASLLAMGF